MTTLDALLTNCRLADIGIAGGEKTLGNAVD